MITLLALGAIVVGGIYYYDAHRTRCSNAGFGIMGSVTYCQRPDGTVYFQGVPTPTPGTVESTG